MIWSDGLFPVFDSDSVLIYRSERHVICLNCGIVKRYYYLFFFVVCYYYLCCIKDHVT